MKRVILVPLFLLFLIPVAGADEATLKLRASYNPGYARIVFEGPQPVIDRAVVNQMERNILVTFAGDRISIETERTAVTYKRSGSDRIILSPGEFRGMKVLRLKNPGRLVIDIFQDEQKGDKARGRTDILGPPPAESIAAAGARKDTGEASEQRKGAAGRVMVLVIDPGHGGFETGIVRDIEIEKNVVLDISRKLEALSEKGSFESSLTRGGDLFMSLGERVKTANSVKPDVFLSIHIGNHRDMVIYIPVVSGSVPETIKPHLYSRGQEAYLKKTVNLLNAMREAATADIGSEMVRVQALPYSILSGTDAAALMIELPSFEYEDYTEEYKMKMVNVLNKGLYLYEENEASR